MLRKKIKPLEKKVWLSSPTMYEDSLKYVMEAYQTNWMSTVGENINKIEEEFAKKIGTKYAVASNRNISSSYGGQTCRYKEKY